MRSGSLLAQPGEPAALLEAAKGETPIALQTVPSQSRGLQLLAPHRFHGIAEHRFDPSDRDRHLFLRPVATPAAHMLAIS
jgi:hypothetical protein